MYEETDWIWPAYLDALKAAPEHHKLLYENEHVRVIEATIPPGEITAVHTHQWPASLYVISWSDFIRYNSEGTLVLDSRNMAKTPVPYSVLWSDPLPPHALKNIGKQDLKIISTEIKMQV